MLTGQAKEATLNAGGLGQQTTSGAAYVGVPQDPPPQVKDSLKRSGARVLTPPPERIAKYQRASPPPFAIPPPQGHI